MLVSQKIIDAINGQIGLKFAASFLATGRLGSQLSGGAGSEGEKES